MPKKARQHGTFLYAEGRERKRRILVDPQVGDDGLEKSLRLARERFGSRLFVSGPPGFASGWHGAQPKGRFPGRFLTGSGKHTGKRCGAASSTAHGGLGGGKYDPDFSFVINQFD